MSKISKNRRVESSQETLETLSIKVKSVLKKICARFVLAAMDMKVDMVPQQQVSQRGIASRLTNNCKDKLYKSLQFILLLAGLTVSSQIWAAPSELIICKALTSNNDARNDSATFAFLPNGGSLTLPNVNLTVSETPTPNTQCTPVINLTGASALSVAQSATVTPAAGQPAWATATGSFGWTATGTGLTGVSGSTQTASLNAAQFTAATGRVTITFIERRQRLATLCKVVEDNAQLPAAQGGAFALGVNGGDVNNPSSTNRVTVNATEGSVESCGAPVELSNTSANVYFGELSALPGGGQHAAGFPKYSAVQAVGGGTAVTGILLPQGLNLSTQANLSSLTGDIKITITNRYAANRTVRICKTIENSPTYTTAGAFAIGISGSGVSNWASSAVGGVNVQSQKVNLTAANGQTVCSTVTGNDAVNPLIWENTFPANWTGNAVGYPKWEMYQDDGLNARSGAPLAGGVDGDVGAPVSAGSAGFFRLNAAAVGSQSIKIVFVNQMAPFGTGGQSGAGDIIKWCKEVEDNGNGVVEGKDNNWGIAGYGGYNYVANIPLPAGASPRLREGMRVCGQGYSRVALRLISGEIASERGLVNATWPGDQVGYPKLEVRSSTADINHAGQVGAVGGGTLVDSIGSMFSVSPAPFATESTWAWPQNWGPNPPTLPVRLSALPKGDYTLNFINRAAPSRQLKFCYRVEDNGIAPNNQTALGLTEGMAPGSTGNCVTFPVPNMATGQPFPTFQRFNGGQSLLNGYGFIEFSDTKADGTAGTCSGTLTFSQLRTFQSTAFQGNGGGTANFITPAALIDQASNTFYTAAGSAPCTGATVNYTVVVRPAPTVQVCKQVLDNGNGIAETGTFAIASRRVTGGWGGVQLNANLSPTEGGTFQCAQMGAQGDAGFDSPFFGGSLSASEQLPSAAYAANLTPSYPRWELRGSGRADASSANGLAFGAVLSGLTGCPATGCTGSMAGAVPTTPNIVQPNGGTAAGLQKMTDDGNLTFIIYNRQGPNRFMRMCQQIDTNIDSVSQNATTNFTGQLGNATNLFAQAGLNQTVAATEGVVANPSTATQCTGALDITAMDPVANRMQLTQSLPAGFVQATGFPTWRVLNQLGVQVASGTGNVADFSLATIGSSDFNVFFTNQSAPATSGLVLKKAWLNGTAGDSVTVGATSGLTNNTAAFSAVNDGNSNVVMGTPVTLVVGETAVLPAETFADAGQAARYSASDWQCTDGSSSVINVAQGGSLSITSANQDKTITCTLTNTAIKIDTTKSSLPASGTAVAIGETISYTLNSTVSGAATKSPVVLTDTLDAGLTVGTLPTGCSSVGQVISCTLPAGSAVGAYSFNYTAKVNSKAVTQVNNRVVADTGTCTNCTTTHPLWSAVTNKTSDAAGKKGVRIGDTITYTVTTEISGGANSQPIVLTDTLGNGLQLNSVPAGCTAAGQVMSCTIPAGSPAGAYRFSYGATVTKSIGDQAVNSVTADRGTCVTCSTSTPVLKEVNLIISKTAKTKTAIIGDFVRYEITVENPNGPDADNFSLVDRPAPGLSYVAGSVRVSGDDSYSVTSEYPLTISGLNLAEGGKLTISYMMRVGASAGRGQLENCAQVDDPTGLAKSNRSCAQISRTADPDFEDTRILGTVFEDFNVNGMLDKGEPGVPGVRLATVEGLLIETDANGRYHIEGIDPGKWARGSNFIVKVDAATLPESTVFTTQNPLVRRLTQGIPGLYNFGVRMPFDPLSPQTRPPQFPVMLLGDGFFAFDRYELKDLQVAGRDKLDYLANHLQQHFGVLRKITIEGHTDRFGSDTYNLALAAKRADTIKAYLVQKGLPEQVMVTLAVGEAKPVVQCLGPKSEKVIACLAPNRRFEMSVDGDAKNEQAKSAVEKTGTHQSHK